MATQGKTTTKGGKADAPKEVKKLDLPATTGGAALVLVQDQLPDHIKQGGARGSENVGTDDLVIPRLEVLQSTSPQCTEGEEGFDPNCRPGDLMNSVTGQNYGRAVFVVPVDYSKQWLVWRDRKNGSGFFGAFPNPDLAADRMLELKKEDPPIVAGVEVIDTPTHLCLIVDRERGSVDEIMISMPRTKAKISRQWNSMVRLTGQDRFARVYQVGSASEKNAKGTFFNFTISQSGFPNKALYERAEKLWASLKEGDRKRTMDVTGFNPEGGGEDDVNTEM